MSFVPYIVVGLVVLLVGFVGGILFARRHGALLADILSDDEKPSH